MLVLNFLLGYLNEGVMALIFLGWGWAKGLVDLLLSPYGEICVGLRLGKRLPIHRLRILRIKQHL